LDPYARSLRAAVGPRYKLIRGSDGSEELYDLIRDPKEQRPLPLKSISENALQELRTVAGEPPGPSTDAQEEDYDPETEAALKALGYIED